MIKLGVLPVRSLLLVEGALWAASGGQVFMASLETHTIEVSQAYPAAACSCIPEAARLSAVQVDGNGWCILGPCVKRRLIGFA